MEQFLLARAEWIAGTPTREIARKVGVSKNALIGVAHRRHFPPRPSPIRVRGSDGTLVPVVMVKGRSAGSYSTQKKPLPPWPPAQPQQAVEEVKVQSCPEIQEKLADTPSPPPMRPVLTHLNPPLAGTSTHRNCQWPMGEPGRPEFRFCGEARLQGGRYPYCPKHYALAIDKKETTK